MVATSKYQNRIELLQGTLDMLVLQALRRYQLSALEKKHLTADHTRCLQLVRANSAVMEPGVQS